MAADALSVERRAILRVSGLVVLALALSLTAIWISWPSRWELVDARGRSLCSVHQGSKRSEVARICGPADRQGTQPKVAGAWRNWQPTFCSAPCELRARRLLFYDCEDRLFTVTAADNDRPAHVCILGGHPARLPSVGMAEPALCDSRRPVFEHGDAPRSLQYAGNRRIAVGPPNRIALAGCSSVAAEGCPLERM
jgi:hypothetical protein